MHDSVESSGNEESNGLVAVGPAVLGVFGRNLLLGLLVMALLVTEDLLLLGVYLGRFELNSCII